MFGANYGYGTPNMGAAPYTGGFSSGVQSLGRTICDGRIQG